MTTDTPHDHERPTQGGDGSGHLPEWESRALDYLDGTLPPPERDRVDAHLATCASCRRDLEDQRAVRVMLSGATMAAPPAALGQAVLAQLLGSDTRPAAASSTTEGAAADGPNRRRVESPAPMADPRRVGRRTWLSGLLRPRVWMPAAATLLLAAVLLSQFHPTATHVALESGKNASPLTTAAAAATAPLGTAAGRQTDQSAAGMSATATTMAGGASVSTTESQSGAPPAVSSGGAPDLTAGPEGPYLSAAALSGGQVWIAVGKNTATDALGRAQTAQLLALLAHAVPIDLPVGSATPIDGPPLYATSASAEATSSLLARLAQAGLDPRVTDAPLTIDAATKAVTTAALFPAGSLVGNSNVPGRPRPGVALGQAFLLVRVGE